MKIIIKKLLFIILFSSLGHSVWCEVAAPLQTSGGLLTGKVVDAQSQKPLSNAVISAIWRYKLRDLPPGGQVIKVRQGYAGSSGTFQVQAFAPVDVRWEAVPGYDPLVRIYAKGYRRLVIENVEDGNSNQPYNPDRAAAMLKWVGQNKVQMLQPWPTKQDAKVKELRLWRNDIDDSIKLVETDWGKLRAIESQEKLLLLFNEMCKTLTGYAQKNVCYAPDSEIGRYISRFVDERAKNIVLEGPNGERQLVTVRIVPTEQNSNMPKERTVAIPGPVPIGGGQSP